MATQLQLRRGTTTEHSTFVGAVGEVTVDTTKDTLVVHDGATTAGFPLAKESTVTALDSAAVHKTGDETVSGTKTFSSNPVLNGGTANGVAYLNGSKVLTTGSALTFDGSSLGVGTSSPSARLHIVGSNPAGRGQLSIQSGSAGQEARISFYDGIDQIGEIGTVGANLYTYSGGDLISYAGGSEQMRLTSTGLGIGTSSPAAKLQIAGKGNGITSNSNGEVYLGDAAAYQGRISYDGYTGTTALYIDNTYDNADAKIQFRMRTAGTPVTALTINGSGNLGLGVTPSAWYSGAKAIQVGNTSIAQRNSSESYIGQNFYTNSSNNFTYTQTGYAGMYGFYNGQHLFYTAPSGTAGNAISFTQAMTLDASGNLGIGTSSPAFGVGSGLEIQRSDTATLRLERTGASASVVELKADSGAGVLETRDASQLILGTSATERMRIDSSGNLLVGTTSGLYRVQTVGTSAYGGLRVDAPGSGSYWPVYFNDTDATSASQILVDIRRADTRVGYIATTNTTTTYSTASDYRLKENIQPMQNALGVVAQLNPVTYTWKADGSDGQGFIAHELQAVVPDCVTGEKDAVDEEGNPVYQGIDTSFLVATLTKAIQEQQELINQLTARVAQLEGK